MSIIIPAVFQRDCRNVTFTLILRTIRARAQQTARILDSIRDIVAGYNRQSPRSGAVWRLQPTFTPIGHICRLHSVRFQSMKVFELEVKKSRRMKVFELSGMKKDLKMYILV
jgi:hypothetical protein